MTSGIDISHWNGDIDWDKVRADGVVFAFAKATEGLTFVDNTFATHWPAMKAAGIIRGAYHFYRPAVDPIAQAEHFLAVAGGAGVLEEGDFPLTMDLETDDGLSGDEVGAGALVFLAHLEAMTGRTPILYTSKRVFETVLGSPAGNFGKYPLWNANYTTLCPDISVPTWPTWTFWQHTDKETIDGISGGCDHNWFNGSVAHASYSAALGRMTTCSPASIAAYPVGSRAGVTVSGDLGSWDAAPFVHLPFASKYGSAGYCKVESTATSGVAPSWAATSVIRCYNPDGSVVATPLFTFTAVTNEVTGPC